MCKILSEAIKAEELPLPYIYTLSHRYNFLFYRLKFCDLGPNPPSFLLPVAKSKFNYRYKIFLTCHKHGHYLDIYLWLSTSPIPAHRCVDI